MSRPSCILLVLCALSLFWSAMQGRAEAQCDTPILSIHVDSIFARETGTDIDQRLGQETARLRALFDYSSYRLLRTDEADTPCGQEVAFFLPIGRILHVRPMATRGNLVALDLALFDGARAMMRQQLKVWRGGLLLFVVSQNPQVAYITSLSVDAPANSHAPRPVEAPTSVASPLPSIKSPISANNRPNVLKKDRFSSPP
jgi:hypothetical protein